MVPSRASLVALLVALGLILGAGPSGAAQRGNAKVPAKASTKATVKQLKPTKKQLNTTGKNWNAFKRANPQEAKKAGRKAQFFGNSIRAQKAHKARQARLGKKATSRPNRKPGQGNKGGGSKGKGGGSKRVSVAELAEVAEEPEASDSVFGEAMGAFSEAQYLREEGNDAGSDDAQIYGHELMAFESINDAERIEAEIGDTPIAERAAKMRTAVGLRDFAADHQAKADAIKAGKAGAVVDRAGRAARTAPTVKRPGRLNVVGRIKAAHKARMVLKQMGQKDGRITAYYNNLKDAKRGRSGMRYLFASISGLGLVFKGPAILAGTLSPLGWAFAGLAVANLARAAQGELQVYDQARKETVQTLLARGALTPEQKQVFAKAGWFDPKPVKRPGRFNVVRRLKDARAAKQKE